MQAAMLSNGTISAEVIDHLDDQMIGFVSRSPFLALATTDASGQTTVSPKGDPPGFVHVIQDASLSGVALLIQLHPCRLHCLLHVIDDVCLLRLRNLTVLP